MVGSQQRTLDVFSHELCGRFTWMMSDIRSSRDGEPNRPVFVSCWSFMRTRNLQTSCYIKELQSGGTQAGTTLSNHSELLHLFPHQHHLQEVSVCQYQDLGVDGVQVGGVFFQLLQLVCDAVFKPLQQRQPAHTHTTWTHTYNTFGPSQVWRYLCWWTAVSSEDTCCWQSVRDVRTSASTFCQQPWEHRLKRQTSPIIHTCIPETRWGYRLWSALPAGLWRTWMQLWCQTSGGTLAPPSAPLDLATPRHCEEAPPSAPPLQVSNQRPVPPAELNK